MSKDSLKGNTDRLLKWLNAVGFAFNPFEVVEASLDSNLSKYLVEHSDFANTWGNWSNVVGAPAGGGKTAMRIRLTQACFTGGDINRPFPINYVIPFLKFGERKVLYDDHLQEIVRTAGIYLLLFIACRPYKFFRLDKKEQDQVCKALMLTLPGPLTTFLEPCIQSNNLNYLKSYFPLSTIPPLQDEKISIEFLRALKETKQAEVRSSLVEKWEILVNALVHILKFPSIYLLVDGIDAAPTTSNNAQHGIEYILPVLEKINILKTSSIFLKLFLPSTMLEVLREEFSELIEDVHTIDIKWTHSNLADVIRKRVFVASEGAFGSLQPFCSPAISEMEMQMARIVSPLPREMIVFTRQLLINHVNSEYSDLLQPVTFKKTIDWYKKTQ